ncbi:MAG: DUF4199 domain-containing protein [Bacteroidota bacterium]
MKRIVIICGSIAGAIVASMTIITIAMSYRSGNLSSNMMLGYATMLLAFSLIFVGIKNYRDKYQNGIISFGKAFKTGLYIALIASTIYVVVWLISYYLFFPDFMELYTTCTLNELKAGGATQIQVDAKVAEMNSYKEMYKNPLMIILLTYTEILPLGILVSLICAFILKRKTKPAQITV